MAENRAGSKRRAATAQAQTVARSSGPRSNFLRLRLLRLAGRLLHPLAAGPRTRGNQQRILLIRPDHVGDVLLSAPAVALLRASLPEASLTYLVGPWSAAAARGGPQVDQVRTVAFPGFTRHAKANVVAPYLTLVRSAARLRRERYAAAVVLRGDHWWGALLALTAGIPVRIGAQTLETGPLLTHAAALRAEAPWGKQALDVARLAIRALGGRPDSPDGRPHDLAQFSPDASARAMAASLWRQHGLDGKRVVGIHPSAGAPLKSWPAVRWAELADQLLERGLEVVLFGAPDEADLLSRIARRMHGRVLRLCGQTLDVSAALYARCALVVTVDSGAGHLAAAVGTRTVRLYGPAPPTVFGPWPPSAGQIALMSDALACAPCGFLADPPCGARSSPACMLALHVDDVLDAIGAELRESL